MCSQEMSNRASSPVVQTKCNEGRDGEPDSSHLSNHSRASRCHVHSHAHEPVAENSTNKRNVPWQVGFGGGNGNRGGSTSESPALECKVCQQERSDEVANVGSHPALNQVLQFNLPFFVCSCDSDDVELSVNGENGIVR